MVSAKLGTAIDAISGTESGNRCHSSVSMMHAYA